MRTCSSIILSFAESHVMLLEYFTHSLTGPHSCWVIHSQEIEHVQRLTGQVSCLVSQQRPHSLTHSLTQRSFQGHWLTRAGWVWGRDAEFPGGRGLPCLQQYVSVLPGAKLLMPLLPMLHLCNVFQATSASLYITSCHIIAYHIIPYRTVPYRTVPYRTVPYHTIPCVIHVYWAPSQDSADWPSGMIFGQWMKCMNETVAVLCCKWAYTGSHYCIECQKPCCWHMWCEGCIALHGGRADMQSISASEPHERSLELSSTAWG